MDIISYSKANKALKLAESMPKIEVVDRDPANPEEGVIYAIIKDPGVPVSDYFFRFDAMELDLSNNDKVSLWPDLSGNGNDLTQTVEADRPTYLAEGLNGLPTVQFADSDLRNTSFALDNDDEATIFIVMEIDEQAESTTLLTILDLEEQDYRLWFRTDSSARITLTVEGNRIIRTDVDQDNPVIYGVTYDSSLARMYENGAFITEDSISGPTIGSHNTLALGIRPDAYTAEPLFGRISEVVYFSRHLSAVEMNAMNNYLMNKWGL